jgi:class 3 adenylate cyclase
MARPALRFVIGFLCALVVLVVAVSTLTVSSIFAGNAVDDIANRFSTALLVAARGKAQSYFQNPTSQITAMAVETRSEGSIIPSDSVSAVPNSVYCTPFKTVMITSQYNYSSVDLQFEDKSYFRVMSFKTRNMVGCGLISAAHDTAPTPTSNADYFYISNYSLVAPGNWLGVVEAVNDTRRNLFYNNRYLKMKNAITSLAPSPAQLDTSRWIGFEAYGAGATVSKLNLVIGKRVYNTSGTYLGIISIAISVEPLQEFLKGLERTAGSQVFALYKGEQVLASTTGVSSTFSGRKAVGANIGVITGTSLNAESEVSRGRMDCYFSEDIFNSAVEQWYCVVRASAYVSYPALSEVAARFPSLVNPSATSSLTVDVAGTSFFVGAEPVQSSALGFHLSVLFFLPTEDVRGDVNRGRNIVIGVAAGVLVLATAISIFVVFKILKPLEAVSTKMDNASKLQIDDVEQNEQDFSSIAEISALQASYANMAVAVSSFVKFVPRDVVLDLISSGELCKLGMQSVEATITFADILGFSEICQRVDPEQLASALVVYFEQMSGIIAAHGSVIDKFVSDSILVLTNIPCQTAHHELKATLCGLMMNREASLEPLRSTWDNLGEMLSLRVGISTGQCNAGNLGANSRMAYTAIGDVVNLGARLETLNRQFNTHVLISGAVAQKVANIFLCRYLIPVQVVGKDEPVHVYEIVGLRQGLNLGELFDKDDKDALISQSVSRMSNASLLSAKSANGPKTSDRAGAKIPTRKMFQRALQLTQATLVASDVEVEFCQEFSQAAETFAQGDAPTCLQMLDSLKNRYPFFFDQNGGETGGGGYEKSANSTNSNNNHNNNRQSLAEAIGNPKRCTSCFIHADASANQLIKACKHVMSLQNPDMYSYVMRATDK